jgi:hypothetical protein
MFSIWRTWDRDDHGTGVSPERWKVAFKTEELMIQVAPARWMMPCQGDTDPDKDSPFCQQDSQYHCRFDTRHPCEEATQNPCQGDTQNPCQGQTQPLCNVDTQRNRGTAPREAGSSGLALLRQQMQELLSN